MAEQDASKGRLKVYCGSCTHSWTEYLELPMDLMEAIDHMNAIRCPKCNGKEIRIGS